MARFALMLSIVVGLLSVSVVANAAYVVDDGTAEKAIGFTGPPDTTGDILWLNRFPVNPAESVITTVSVAYGSQVSGVPDQTPVSILLYEDANGGSTLDAVLRAQVDGFTSASGTNTFVQYDVPPTPVSGYFLVGVLLRAQQQGWYPAAIDLEDPSVPDTSFGGFFANPGAINPFDLNSIPAGQYRAIEEFGFSGNWLVRAAGVPEPGTGLLLALSSLAAAAARNRRAAPFGGW